MLPESDETKARLAFPLGRRRIGRYELLIPLASGGMATVYWGRFFGMAGFEKLVAIKVIHPHLALQDDFVDMFLDEARLSAQIHHPNALEIFEVGEDEGLLFMVAELVRGQSLQALINAASQAQESLEPQVYLSIIAKVCDALHSAHTLKSADGSPLHLVHRDISPSNILISYDGFIKLIDFGIAFAMGRDSTTRSNVVKGKLGYMAPEQWTKDPLDRRADIFSLGVVLYCLATGQNPFPGDTDAEQISQLLKADPIPPRVIFPKLDAALERTILKALAKHPADRHQTAEELRIELRALLLPFGGLVESTDIAALMVRYFSKRIERDRIILERAIATAPDATVGSPLGEDETSIEGRSALVETMEGLPNRPFQSAAEAKGQALSDTERMDHLAATAKSHRRQWALIFIIPAVALAVGLAMLLNVQQWARDLLSGAHSTELSPKAVQKTSGIGLDSSSVAPTQAVAEKIEQPSDRPTDDAETAKSVALALEGLPDAARVWIDGKDAAVVHGRIWVPGDGRQRKLKVIAKGYLPYQETIAPKSDGQIALQLQKKRTTPQRKSKVYKAKDKTTDNEMLAQCPYCDR
jgi:serine/threonine-protein kinase